MGSLAAFSIMSAMLLSLLWAVYMLTLSRLKAPALRRASILCILILSLSLPIINDYSLSNMASGRTGDAISHLSLSPIADNPASPIYNAIAIIIVTGMAIASVAFIFALLRILMLRTTTTYHHGHKLKIISESPTSTFCFLGSIYLSEQDFREWSEMIITHENSHVVHWHFIDLFLGRLVLILQWWNPMAWLLVKEMQRVHEYQADDDVLQAGFDPKEYQYLLLNKAIGETHYSFVNGFKHNELKGRLEMINSRPAGWKKGAALTTILILGISISYALPKTPIISSISANFSAVSVANLFHRPTESLDKEPDNRPQVFLDGIPISYESMSNLNTNAIDHITVRKNIPEYPNGVIEIDTKAGVEPFSN